MFFYPVVSSNMASWKLSELHYWLLDKYPYIAGYNTHEQTSVLKKPYSPQKITVI